MVSDFLADLRRYTARRPAGKRELLGIFFRSYGAQAMFVFRFGKSLRRALHTWWLAPIATLGWVAYLPLSAYVRHALGIRLDLSAEVGPGFYIGHFGNIHLSHCKLGRNCAIGHSTQILPLDGDRGPVIGDRVWIGAHARILGPVSIGSGSTVSAAAVVTRNICEQALCLGRPARVVAHPYDNRRLLGLD